MIGRYSIEDNMFYQLTEVQYFVFWINRVHWGNQKENNEFYFHFPQYVPNIS